LNRPKASLSALQGDAMNAFIDSVRNGFTGLFRFSGRDPARRFWPMPAW